MSEVKIPPGKCQFCGATVARYLSKNNRVIYHCNGALDDKTCGHRATYGPGPSRRLIADVTPIQPAPKKEPEDHDPQEEPAGDAGTVEPTGSGDTGKRKRGGGWPFDD